MTREEYQRIKTICSEALDTRPEERDTLIRTRCGEDLEIEFEVRRMLDRMNTTGILDRSPADSQWLRALSATLAGFEAGQVVGGRFELVRKIGRGGMGEVWEANDSHGGRTVAIKSLRPEIALDERARSRLEREMNYARRISHPNVCPTYDFFVDSDTGLPFLSMQLLEGDALSDRLKSPEPLPRALAIQILKGCAAGLEAAHTAGLIHRDFKPANVMLVPESGAGEGAVRAVVTDFGLSRPAPGKESTTSLSAVGAGTPHYMAPEQREGKDLTAAVDVYSFGVTACEVLTGKRPAEGGLEVLEWPWRRAVRAAIDPEPGRRPLRPGAVLDMALGYRRRQAAGWGASALAASGAYLWWKRSRAPQPERSVAILPFEAGGPSVIEAEGLVGEIHAALAKVPELRVIATESSLRQSRSLDLAAVGLRLGAANLLTGMMSSEGDRVELSVRLVDATTRSVRWAEVFRGSRAEAARFPSRVASGVAANLGGNAVVNSKLHVPAPAAHGAYVRGRTAWARRDPESLRAALTAFEEAIGLDPQYALAHAARADTMAIMTEAGLLPGETSFQQAGDSAREALRVDPELAEGWAAQGLVESLGYWDLVKAREALEKAIARQPSSLYAHMWLAAVYTKAGMHDKGIEEARLTRRLDPLSARQLLSLGWTYVYARRYAEAMESARLLERDFANEIYSCALTVNAWLGLGKPNEAVAALDGCHEKYRLRPNYQGVRGLALARAGRRAEALECANTILKAEGPPARMELAGIFAGLDQRNEVFHWLGQAADAREPIVIYVPQYFIYDAVRSDPRYAAFAQRLTGQRK